MKGRLVKFLADTYPNIGRLVDERKTLDDEIKGMLGEALGAYNQAWFASHAQLV